MFTGMLLGGVIFFGVLLVTVALAANAVWRAVMPPPGLPRGAACGSCGYELTTVEGGRCSECGADLLKAGVTTRRNVVRTAGSLPAALLGWTVIAATLAGVGLYVVSWYSLTTSTAAMATTNYTATYTFGPTTTYDNEQGRYISPADFKVSIAVDVTGDWSGPADTGTITVDLSSGDQQAVIQYPDASDTAWVMIIGDTEAARGDEFTRDDALAAFRAVGLDPDANPAVPVYATQFETLLDAAQYDPFNYESETYSFTGDYVIEQTGGGMSNAFNGNPFTTGNTTLDVIIPLLIAGGCGLFWLLGVIFIVVRRNRLVAGPRAV